MNAQVVDSQYTGVLSQQAGSSVRNSIDTLIHANYSDNQLVTHPQKITVTVDTVDRVTS